ncbi:sugar kinase [Acetobacteraceae bacterium H6797]|nr:sugar kinase [Acetobacteraceae bacterium H6797]
MKPEAPPRVLCIGHVVADHTFQVPSVPAPPAKLHATGYTYGLGGMAANAAIAATKLGGRGLFWGRAGEDPTGRYLVAALQAEGVETAIRLMRDGHTPTSAVLVDPRGERTIISFPGSGMRPKPWWLPLPDLSGASVLLCDPRWPEAAEAAMKAAREQGVPSVMDAERSDQAVLVQLVPLVDHALFSETGLTSFAGQVSAEEGLRKALSVGAKVAGVTRGEKSTLWIDSRDGQLRETPAFKVTATNTTGAGDVFHGAYALALAEKKDVPAAMRFASAAGACRARDGKTPDRATLEALMAEQAA